MLATSVLRPQVELWRRRQLSSCIPAGTHPREKKLGDKGREGKRKLQTINRLFWTKLQEHSHHG